MQILKLCGAALLLFATSLSIAQQSDDYILAPGDQLAIAVFGEPDLTVEFALSDNGVKSYPFLGEIRIAGMTTSQLEKHIADGLRGDYLINPEVTVSITQYRPFFLNGEVKMPGGYPYQPGLTLEKALALAGGLTARAARNKITVKRDSGASLAAVNIEMSDTIRAGDVITVPQTFF